MSSDIRIAVDFYDHPKTVKLMAAFGAEGVVRLQRLWIWAARYRPKGILSKMDDLDWIAAFDYNGSDATSNATSMRDALLRIGFLEKGRHGRVKIHDWNEHNPYVFYAPERKQRAKNAAKARWGKKIPTEHNSCGTHADSNATSNATGNAPSPSPSPIPRNNTTTFGGSRRPSRKRETSTPDHKRFIEFWMTEYERQFNVKYAFNGGKDAKHVQKLLKDFGYERLCGMALIFLNTDDQWVLSKGITLGVFQSQANPIAQQMTLKERKRNGSAAAQGGTGKPVQASGDKYAGLRYDNE